MLGAILDEIRKGIESGNRGVVLWKMVRENPFAGKVQLRLQKKTQIDFPKSSTVLIDVDMLHGINYLVDKLHGYARYGSLCFGKGTLQRAQGHTRFLSGYPGEQLGETGSDVTVPDWE